MKKLSVFTLLVILAMALASCAGGASSNATPGVGTETTGGGVTAPTSDLSGGGVTAPTSDLSGGGVISPTSDLSGGGVTSPTSDLSGGVSTTEPLGTSVSTSIPATGATSVVGGLSTSTSVAGGGVAVGTSVSGTSVPTTGNQIGQFARLSQLIGFNISDSSSASVGTVSDFIINLPKTRVDYIVVNYSGNSVLVPWTSLAFNSSAGNSFTFNGDATRLQNAPAFNMNSVDWTSQTWDQDVSSFWASGASGSGTSVSGTSVAGSTGSGVSGTSVAGGTGVSGTPVVGSTSTSGNGPIVAIPYSQLASVNVVEASSSVPATGSTGVAGTSVAGTSTSGSSGMSSTETAGSSSMSSTSTAGNSGMSSTSTVGSGSVPATGSSVGTIQDALVNVMSGELPYFLLTTNSVPNTGSSGTGTSGTSVVPMGTVEPFNMSTPDIYGMGTSVSTTNNSSGMTSGTSTAGSVPATGSSNVVPVPSTLIRFVDLNTAVLQFAGSMLNAAPTLNLSTTPTLNAGWDAQYLQYWSAGGAGSSSGGGSATQTP